MPPTSTRTAAQVMAAMNSYMLPHGTRSSARPLLATEVMWNASPAQVSRNAPRSHVPSGHSDGLAVVSAGSGRPPRAEPDGRPPGPAAPAAPGAAPSAASPATMSLVPALLVPTPLA